MKVIATANNSQEILELKQMLSIIAIGIRSRHLGKVARHRMSNGDFQNKPTIKKQNKKETNKTNDVNYR